MSKTTEQRKADHIELAFKSQMQTNDTRFYYEPVLGAHADDDFKLPEFSIGNKVMQNPIWISSMTGGTKLAAQINKRMALACQKFGLAMGLGSCRILLDKPEYLPDFQVRKEAGEHTPIYANLGIAQMQEIFGQQKEGQIQELIKTLEADGLIIHLNPLQEWLQPEGDRYFGSPLDTIKHALDTFKFPIIVKEVGQGMGPNSLTALLNLPLAALDFGAFGGTNFAKLEALRNKEGINHKLPYVNVGHTAAEMVNWVNDWAEKHLAETSGKRIIVSGGIQNYLDGYYYTEKLNLPAIYGQASAILKHAMESQQSLDTYINEQIEGLKLAHQLLRINNNDQ